MQKVCSNDLVYAGFFARLAAWVIDWCILLPCISLICMPLGMADLLSGAGLFSTAVLFRFTLKDIVKYVLALAYFVILTYNRGATVGKMAMNLRVVQEDGSRPDLLTVFYREFIGKFLSRIILYVGYFMIGADREKAGLHDKLSDTRVVYAKKILVYPTVRGRAGQTAWVPPMQSDGQAPMQGCSEVSGQDYAETMQGYAETMQGYTETSERDHAETMRGYTEASGWEHAEDITAPPPAQDVEGSK